MGELDCPQDLCSGSLLISSLGKLFPAVQKLFRQLLDPVFRGRMIVGRQCCYDYTRFPYNLPVRGRILAPANQLGRARMLRDMAVRWNVQTSG
jgi:hypothetical protein